MWYILTLENQQFIKSNVKRIYVGGKYYERDGRVIMPVLVQVYLSFVDGIYIGQFVDKLQKCLDEL